MFSRRKLFKLSRKNTCKGEALHCTTHLELRAIIYIYMISRDQTVLNV